MLWLFKFFLIIFYSNIVNYPMFFFIAFHLDFLTLRRPIRFW